MLKFPGPTLEVMAGAQVRILWHKLIFSNIWSFILFRLELVPSALELHRIDHDTLTLYKKYTPHFN